MKSATQTTASTWATIHITRYSNEVLACFRLGTPAISPKEYLERIGGGKGAVSVRFDDGSALTLISLRGVRDILFSVMYVPVA